MLSDSDVVCRGGRDGYLVSEGENGGGIIGVGDGEVNGRLRRLWGRRARGRSARVQRCPLTGEFTLHCIEEPAPIRFGGFIKSAVFTRKLNCLR